VRLTNKEGKTLSNTLKCTHIRFEMNKKIFCSFLDMGCCYTRLPWRHLNVL